MSEVQSLIESVADARAKYLAEVKSLSPHQTTHKVSDDIWNAIEITEHLYWVEQAGQVAIYKTIQAIAEGKTVWEGEHINKGLSIESIIERTWQPKEIAPAIVTPRLGGSIDLWTAYLKSLDIPLQALADKLKDTDLDILSFPNPVSGSFDIRHRLEFLRFHLNRHHKQVSALKFN